jgi:2'-hydroxyisoflavone reductase
MIRPTRRSFLASSALLSAAPALHLAAAGGGRGKRMLVLGGTRFLGPQVVLAAEALGYEVTLFNRGRSDPERFARLEQRVGDRDTGDLSALAEGRWDVVVDTSGYAPDHVRASAELLRDRVGHYVFVSTISVYADQSADQVGEDTAVLEVAPEVVAAAATIPAAARHYGAMKALCERAAEAAMPGRVAVVRPGLIVGPEDSSDRFTYWPVRVRQGGEILAPGLPDQEVQFVDVRDLGPFCVRLGDRAMAGTWNAVGFPFRLGFEEFLHGCKVALNADCRFHWVDEAFLRENRVRPYLEMPLWLPAGQRGHVDLRRALEAGLTFRSVADTIRDTADWYAAEWPEGRAWERAGMKPDREAALLAAWRAR